VRTLRPSCREWGGGGGRVTDLSFFGFFPSARMGALCVLVHGWGLSAGWKKRTGMVWRVCGGGGHVRRGVLRFESLDRQGALTPGDENRGLAGMKRPGGRMRTGRPPHVIFGRSQFLLSSFHLFRLHGYDGLCRGLAFVHDCALPLSAKESLLKSVRPHAQERPADGHTSALSNFRLARVAKAFEGPGTYVPGLKGQK
jgi:hypothetical protein